MSPSRETRRTSSKEAGSTYAAAFRSQRAGKTEEAAALYHQVIRLRPEHAEARFNLGDLHLKHNSYRAAAEHLEESVRLQPNRIAARVKLAAALSGVGKVAEALEQYLEVLRLDPENRVVHRGLGDQYSAMGDAERAVCHYRQAIRREPCSPELHHNLAAALTVVGDLEQAEEHYTAAIRLRPGFAISHYNRANIHRFRPGDAELADLEVLAAQRDIAPAAKSYIHFALGKALEDTGEYDRALEHLDQGNRMVRRQNGYDEARELARLRQIPEVFHPGMLKRLRGADCDSFTPIFILGMPRSGSTLVEQVLASHPAVHGAGESPNLELAMAEETGPGAPPFPENVNQLSECAWRRIGESYVRRMQLFAGDKQCVVDKLPDNFQRIGLIHLAVPNARIIHSHRDPADTCVSCYTQRFVAGQAFTYDLGELGRYFIEYKKLMDYWREVLPANSILDVGYEDLIGDPEAQTRRMLEFCGLTWDERCLEFYRTRRPVNTASAVQVRRPLYRDSLQRWRRFEKGLGPLLEELGRSLC